MINKQVLALAASLFCGSLAAQDCQQDFNFISPTGHAQGTANIATLQKGLGAAAKGDFDTFMSIAAKPYIQHSPDLPDGWKPVWDLTTNRAKNFSSKIIPWIASGGFMNNGPFLVMFREVNHGNGPQKKFDLMYFEEDGLYSEHWDMAQPIIDTTTSGQSETGTAKVFIDNPVAYDQATEDANRRMVTTFLNLAFNAGELQTGTQLYADLNYVQYQTPRDALSAGKETSRCYDIQHILAQNDLVFVYSKVTDNRGSDKAVVDLFRVRNGLLVEHWDVVQAVPANMPHDNGMF